MGCADRVLVVLALLAGAPTALAAPDHPGQNGGLTLEQDAMAATAWRYFENNFQPSTCLYNSVDGYPSTTMWDTASALAALVSAHELGILETADFEERVHCMLLSLERMPLYQGVLPNKAYNTVTLEQVDYANNPGEIGVSAIDLGRLLTWLAIIKERDPRHSELVDRIVLRWNFCDLIDRGGTLYGALNGPNGGVRYVQEGRLGYEEYAANGFQLWGFGTPGASRQEPYEETSIYGVRIAYDGRNPAAFGAHNYVVTEAYLLNGLEMNWDVIGDTNPDAHWHSDLAAATLAKRAYRAQARRYRRTGILTARTEHHVDGPPYFVYDTVYSDGVPWNTISDDGKPWPQLAAVSTKAALGMWVLFDTKYGRKLAEAVSHLQNPEKGLYEGMYEADGRKVDAFTANTNGIVLETLLYKKEGKLVQGYSPPSLWDRVPNDEYSGITQCLPRRVPAVGGDAF